METKNRIKAIISKMKQEGKPINTSTIITESLFSSGGTLAGKENEIGEIIWEIRNNIEKRINKQYPNQNINGLAYGIEVNKFFNL